MDNMYYDFVNSVKAKLNEEINGRIVWEIYKNIDTVIFKISFKGFDYAYPVAGVQEYIYSGGSAEDVVENLKQDYLRTIKKTFFKSEQRKKRDEMAKLGVGAEG